MAKAKSEATGVLSHNLIVIDDTTHEWIDSEDFSFAELAREIGVNINHKVKAKVTFEVVLEPCLFCGQPTVGSNLCEECQVIVCESCIKTSKGRRLCPKCFNKENKTSETLPPPP
jgi:hypothetical protein